MLLTQLALQVAPAAKPPPARPAEPRVEKVDPKRTPAALQEAAVAQRNAERDEDIRRRALEEKARLEREERDRVLSRERDARRRVEEERAARREDIEPTRSLAGVSAARSGVGGEGADGPPRGAGRAEWAVTATAVAGYNDNVQQTQDSPTDPVFRKRPATYVGGDVSAILQLATARSAHDIRIQARGQHYFPRGNYTLPDDGTLNVMYQGRWALGRVTTGTLFVGNTLTTLNSTRLSDGIVFRFDPNNVPRTVDLATVRGALAWELDPRWRYEHAADVGGSTIIATQPTVLPNGSTYQYTGFDFFLAGTTGTLTREFDPSNVGFLRARYYFTVNRAYPDLTASPPPDPGFVQNHGGDMLLGYEHLFSQRFASRSTAGAAFAVPTQPGVSGQMSPSVEQAFSYTAPRVYARIAGGYNLGVVGPAFGVGTSAYALGSASAEPFDVAPLRPLQLLANFAVSRSEVQFGTTGRAALRYLLASIEARYPLTNWLAVMAGYNFRWSEYLVPPNSALTTFERNVVYGGLTVFFSSTRDAPPLTNFTPLSL